MKKVAFITGINGQDGSYLSEILLKKEYDVWGMLHSKSSDISKINHIYKNLYIRYGDLTNETNISDILNEICDIYDKKLDVLEIYNLGSQSDVKLSFELPEYTTISNSLGTLKILEAIRRIKINNKIKFYQASTSEMFGKACEMPQTETTPFYPSSPYGIAKLYAYWIVKNYREYYNMYACNGILFNHESPRRSSNFVTRKITLELGKIIRGESTRLNMGNLDAKRDWGHAKDYCYGMWLILQQKHPDDFVLATGKHHTIKEFIEKAFALKNLNIKWKGVDINEIGYDENTGRELIFVDPQYFRPMELNRLLGNPEKAKKTLGWEPKITFDDLIKEMVNNDCE